MTRGKGEARAFFQRTILWIGAGCLDFAYIVGVAGYEGAFRPATLALFTIIVFLCCGIVVWLVVGVFSARSHSSGHTINGPRFSLCWDAGILFLLVVGLRVNEELLPSFSNPRSVIGNILLLLAAIGIVWFCRLVSRRLPKGATHLVLGLAGVLVVLLAVMGGLERGKLGVGNPPENSPNVLLITLDTVRADHLGCYGYERDTSPAFDAFAVENHLFTNMRTPMPLTLPAHGSLFTGLPPHELGLYTNGSPFAEDPGIVPLAEELAKLGYATAGFPAAYHVGKRFGMDRGFMTHNQSTVIGGPSWLQDIYEVAPIAVLSRLGLVRETYVKRDSRAVNKAFFHWLDKAWSRERRFFCWVHYFDTHAPYQPPEEYWRRYDEGYSGWVTGCLDDVAKANAQYEATGHGERLPEGFTQADIENLQARYDGEIRYQDESLGELLDGVSRRGIWDDTVIVIVTDHGEGMYDDGYFGHNHTLREYEILLGCAIKGPRIECPPERQLSITDLTEYVRLVTALSLSSERCRLAGAEESDRLSDDPRASMVFLRSHCWIDRPYKLVRTYMGNGKGVTYSLYNLVEDPEERDDLFDSTEEVSQRMRGELMEWIERNDIDFPALIRKKENLRGLDATTLEMLRSLGYIY